MIEHGKVFVRDPQAGERDVTLTGAGGGLRIHVPGTAHLPALGLVTAYAERIGGAAPSDGSDGVFYLGGQLSF